MCLPSDVTAERFIFILIDTEIIYSGYFVILSNDKSSLDRYNIKSLRSETYNGTIQTVFIMFVDWYMYVNCWYSMIG